MYTFFVPEKDSQPVRSLKHSSWALHLYALVFSDFFQKFYEYVNATLAPCIIHTVF